MHPIEGCSITVDQVFIRSDRLVGHRCAKPSGSVIPVIAWLDACDVQGVGDGGGVGRVKEEVDVRRG